MPTAVITSTGTQAQHIAVKVGEEELRDILSIDFEPIIPGGSITAHIRCRVKLDVKANVIVEPIKEPS